MRRIGLILLLLFSCGGKGPRTNARIVGWHQEPGWAGACLYPPQFDTLGVGDRKLARQDALKQMTTQWRGERNDGIHFEEEIVERLETVLLGTPDLIEAVSVDNLAQCKEAMRSGDSSAWSTWVADAPPRLTVGQCLSSPMDYQLFDYLDIGKGWQIPVRVCKGDVVTISSSTQDEYRIEEKGPWINGGGDPTKPSIGTNLPCNIEGCLAGMVIGRFTATATGDERIFPVGLGATFEVKEHGKLEVQINDDTWFDNTYRVVGRIEHHTAIEYQGE